MYFSPSVLNFLLSQPMCDGRLRRTLVDKFGFESEEWPLLDRVRLADNLPATRDPVLLAFRRLVRRDFEGLRAQHRLAAENAEKRPFGLLYLVLEEAIELARLDDEKRQPAERGEALRIFFELLAASEQDGPDDWELFDLRARGVAEAIGRCAGVPGSFVWLGGEEVVGRSGPASRAGVRV